MAIGRGVWAIGRGVWAVAAMLAATAASGSPVAQPADYVPPGLSGFPAGYFVPCDTRPASAITVVPAPESPFMRVICAKVSDALAPPPGYVWAFTNGTEALLTALNAKNVTTGASFTRLADAPLSPAEVAAFRARLRTVVNRADILNADVLRLEVDTSTGDHKQEYLMVAHTPSGQVTGVWGIECFNDCDPMENPPYAFTVVPAAGR